MARHPQNPERILRQFLLGVSMLVVALPIYAQTRAPVGIPAKPDPQATQGTLASEVPSSANQSLQPSPTASPADEREAKIEADTKRLYQLSAELRAEVARTYKDSLSLTVLKKAEEIERLAKGLKVLMSKEAASAKR